jgi:hypothetical protein
MGFTESREDESRDCEYCKPVYGASWCQFTVTGKDGRTVFCTRHSGHDGPCVACSCSQHDITGAATNYTSESLAKGITDAINHSRTIEAFMDAMQQMPPMVRVLAMSQLLGKFCGTCGSDGNCACDAAPLCNYCADGNHAQCGHKQDKL